MLKIKLLLLFIILTIIPSTYAAEDKFYVKATIAVNKTNEIKEYLPDLHTNLKNSSNFSPAIGLGLGYYINNYLRTDIMFEQIDFLFNKESACISFSDNDFSCKGVAYIKRNSEAKSLMLNSYVDILDRDTFKFFVGGGMGIANIKETIKRSASGKAQSINHEETDFTYSENSISKSKNNFAYALMFGTNMKLNPRINLELMYTWKDFGKVKHKSIDSNQYAIKNKYKGHNFSTGLRFDL